MQPVLINLILSDESTHSYQELLWSETFPGRAKEYYSETEKLGSISEHLELAGGQLK